MTYILQRRELISELFSRSWQVTKNPAGLISSKINEELAQIFLDESLTGDNERIRQLFNESLDLVGGPFKRIPHCSQDNWEGFVGRLGYFNNDWGNPEPPRKKYGRKEFHRCYDSLSLKQKKRLEAILQRFVGVQKARDSGRIKLTAKGSSKSKKVQLIDNMQLATFSFIPTYKQICDRVIKKGG